jgi:hypothetical protein
VKPSRWFIGQIYVVAAKSQFRPKEQFAAKKWQPTGSIEFMVMVMVHHSE